MRADIARHVCRRRLATVAMTAALPIVPTGVPTAVATRCFHNVRPRVSTRVLRYLGQSRTFLDLLTVKPDHREAELEPGWDNILRWVGRMHDNLRTQKRSILIKAFVDLFAYKNRFGILVNSSQANQCMQLFRYLMDDPLEEGGPGLTLDDLVMVREALLKGAPDREEYHLVFSKELFEEIREWRVRMEDDEFGQGLAAMAEMEVEADGEVPTAEDNPETVDPRPSKLLATVEDSDFQCYLKALAQFGAASEAAKLLKFYWHDLMKNDRIYRGSKSLWITVMRGLVKEDKEEELIELVSFSEVASIEYMPAFHETMVTFFARKNRITETREWFRKPIYGKWLPTAKTYYEILKFCVRTTPEGEDTMVKESRWVKDIFQNLIEKNPRKDLWDVCFQWAVVALGKGPADIKRMFEIMEQNNPGDPIRRPDISTINALIRAAADRNEPLLAERFVTLATELGIKLNATTITLQLEYRLDASDMSGAKAAYLDLQLTDVAASDVDMPVVNRYIRALCHVRTLDMSMAKRVVSDLEARSITLEPATVVALSIAMLQTNNQKELADTLSLNVFQFSASQRSAIREAFVGFILDPNNSLERAWQAYVMLHHYFTETPLEDRLWIIEGFFRRSEPTKAATVFANMCEHSIPTVHPTTEDYITIFQYLHTYTPSPSALRTIYNLLKMDPNVVPSTRLYNAIMLAFGSCGQHAKALEFWNEVAHSIEGPSYESLAIVFWICEGMPFGEKTARVVWGNLERMDIDVPPAIAGGYAGALAGGGVLGDVIKFFKGMKGALGYEPDADMLGIAYNAFPGQDLQRSFEHWVRTAFPKQWMHLDAIGRDETPNFLQKFRIERLLKA